MTWWLVIGAIVLYNIIVGLVRKREKPRDEQHRPQIAYTRPSTPSLRHERAQRRKKATPQVAVIPDDFEMTEDFSRAFDLMENSHENLYITGNAGTGKSTLLQYFREKTRRKIVVVAPTGVAALNVGGATIHSFFRFPARLVKKEDVKRLANKRDVFMALDALVIDEISMVRADVMDAMDLSLRMNRGRTAEPFGGVQMILIGDLYQLPPVVDDAELKEYFDEQHGSPFFFNAHVFKEVRLEKIELKKNFRQTDANFIALLNKVRNNDVSGIDLQQLNSRLNAPLFSSKGEVAITVTTTNNLAGDINEQRLEALPGKEHVYRAQIYGDFDSERNAFPAERILRLRQGAQVMLVKNDPDKRWVNGTLATVHRVSEDSVHVSIAGATSRIEQATWEKIEYEYDRDSGKIEPIVTGSFRQYPIKLAWAVTIHKSQGKTFDKVMIDVGSRGAFAHGQLYVALSRCRSFEGISLKRPLKYTDIILDDRVTGFHESGNNGG